MTILKLSLVLGTAFLLLGCEPSPSEEPLEETSQPVTLNNNQNEMIPAENISPIAKIDFDAPPINEEVDSSDLDDEQLNSNDDELDYGAFETVEQLIWHDIDAYGMDSDYLSISYHDFTSGEEFHLNADQPSHGASTNKVGTAVLYADLINEGILSWESPLPFSASWFEEGAGDITASPDQSSYTVYDLVYQSLFYSDNTAWNTLINNYYNSFGDFQTNLIELSGLEVTDGELYNLNYATTRMLNEILIRVASDENYQPIVDIMLAAQDGIYLKMYVSEGMAAKYGQYDEGFHDTGIYYDQDVPAYTIAVMSHELGPIDYFLGDLNLHLKQYHDYHTVSLN